MFRVSIAEQIVIRLSHAFMRLPLTRDCMALAWSEGRNAQQYGYASDGNPYVTKDA